MRVPRLVQQLRLGQDRETRPRQRDRGPLRGLDRPGAAAARVNSSVWVGVGRSVIRKVGWSDGTRWERVPMSSEPIVPPGPGCGSSPERRASCSQAAASTGLLTISSYRLSISWIRAVVPVARATPSTTPRKRAITVSAR